MRWIATGRGPRLVAVLALASCGPDGELDRPGEASSLRGVPVLDPVEVPPFALDDTRGEIFEFRDRTAGRLTFLFFGYTSCPDICPVQLANLAAALGDLPYSVRRQVAVVFVTTDPGRDTADVLREYLDRFDRSFIGLTGSMEEVNAIQTGLRLPPSVVQEIAGDPAGRYLVGHASQILAIDGAGRVLAAYPAGIRQSDWRHDLPLLLESK